MPDSLPSLGRVFLVGAGPGDPGLLTLRGAECLRLADVVFYDSLANPQLLEHTEAGTELICLGRHGVDRLLPQAEVNQRLIAAARAGLRVVRLKGGDPTVFGRLPEEIQALLDAGVSFEIVPGVSTATAAGAYAGVSLTNRDAASAVAFFTGQEGEKPLEALDFAALARFPGTLVVYMGVTTAETWVRALLAEGKPAATPAILLRRCSWPDQETIRCSLADVPSEIRQRRLRPPVLAIVGDVAASDVAADWFLARPLRGQRILVTRAAEQAHSLRDRFQELGAEVFEQPAIQIEPAHDTFAVDHALRRMNDYDWLVFSSANGVRFLLSALDRLGLDLRTLGGVRLAAIGPGTAEALAHFHLLADVTPETYQAEGLMAALAAEAQGRRFLLARASRGRELLADELKAAGATVDQVVVYESRDVDLPNALIAAELAAGRIDWITVTSSAIARSLVHLFGDHLRAARLVSLSPVTTATLRELGHAPAAEARQATMDDLVAAVVAAAG